MQDMRKMIMIIAAVAMLTACGSGQTGQVDPEADTTATVPVEKLALPLPEPGVVQTVGKVVAERYADLAFLRRHCPSNRCSSGTVRKFVRDRYWLRSTSLSSVMT